MTLLSVCTLPTQVDIDADYADALAAHAKALRVVEPWYC